jgi:hypothetical protein
VVPFPSGGGGGGAAPRGCSEEFRGAGPFSEPETQVSGDGGGSGPVGGGAGGSTGAGAGDKVEGGS